MSSRTHVSVLVDSVSEILALTVDCDPGASVAQSTLSSHEYERTSDELSAPLLRSSYEEIIPALGKKILHVTKTQLEAV
jgi:hypothetical protein